MSGWFKSFGTLHHGFGGRFKLGSLAPAEEFDEAVTKGQLSEFDGPISTVSSLSATTLSSTTLNVDFTDTLDFFTGNVDEQFGPLVLDGPFIGLKALKNDTLIISGLIDNNNDAIENVTVVTSDRGFVLENNTDSADRLERNTVAFFPDVDGGQVAFGVNHLYDANLDGAGSLWYKLNDSFEGVYLGYSDNKTGLVLNNALSDNEASLFSINDNNEDSILDIRNDGIFVGPNIPTADPLVLGQIWLDGDTLKVSAGAP